MVRFKNFKIYQGKIMDKNVFKNQYFIFLLSFIAETIFYFIFNDLNIGGRYLTPDIALAPVLGLMFGPAAGLGMASSTAIYDILTGATLLAGLVDGFIFFFLSVVSFKLWYTFMNKDKSRYLKLDSTYNVMKFMLISLFIAVLFNCLLYLSRLALPTDMLSIYTLLELNEKIVSYTINIFDFSLVYGFIGITVANYFNIPLFSPLNYSLNQASFKTDKLNYLLLLIVVLSVISIIIDYNQIISLILFAIALVSSLIYIFAPINMEYHDDGRIVDFSLNEILIIGLTAIVVLLVMFNYYDVDIPFLNFNPHFEVLLKLGVIFIILMLVSILHLNFVEKNITNPINELIKTINLYTKENIQLDYDTLKGRFGKYEGNNDDITRLIHSLYKMSNDINLYLRNLKEVTAENAQYKTELDISNKIQADMLPLNFEEFADGRNFEIHGSMVPAREVGGDFYDFFNIDDENVAIGIGDVSGKGIPAALFMVKTMTLIRNHTRFTDNVSEIFMDVNNALSERNINEYFVTSWFASFDLLSGDLSFVNAGHNQPLVCIDGEVSYLDAKPGLVLAAMEGIPYRENSIRLDDGDFIVLYTDGVTEANDNYNGFYGEDRLKHIVDVNKDRHPKEIVQAIKDDVREFTNNAEQFDDTTVLVLKYNGGI